VKKHRLSAQARKLAIVKAALPLFARKGYAATTTKELARAAGVSEPLLYKHFPSKEALYLEIQNFCCSGNDPAARKATELLAELEPSASTLVYLVYYLMRVQVLGTPPGAVERDTRLRLMVNSFLEDGVFARLMYENRFDCFCSRIEASLDAAIASGDAIPGPLTSGNRGRFAQHVGGWLALVRLPPKAAINYKVSGEALLRQAVWFVLRGMGMTDKAIATHYNPKALALVFGSQA
jgi:TetR/AcrR family transcriptional regulator, transcriptional repressor of aconitase